MRRLVLAVGLNLGVLFAGAGVAESAPAATYTKNVRCGPFTIPATTES